MVPRDSLLVTTRATLGSVALAAMPLATNQGFKSAVLGTEGDPAFFYHLLRELEPELIRRASGTTFLEISGAQFRQIVVPLPPLREQQRIAEILDTIDESMRSADRVISKLRYIEAGLLYELLARGVDGNGQTRPATSGLELLPEGWESCSLQDIGADRPYAIVDGPFGSNLKSMHYRSSGIPVIQSGFVTSQRFVAKEYVYVDETLFRQQYRSAVRPGDIVMAKIGATCGACAALPDDHPVGILAGNSLKITVNASRCIPDYLLLVLHRYFESGELNLIRTETAQPAISLGRLRKLRIRLPPLGEQRAIVSVARAAEERVARERLQLEKLRMLKSGVAAALLAGRVRVRLDDKDVA